MDIPNQEVLCLEPMGEFLNNLPERKVIVTEHGLQLIEETLIKNRETGKIYYETEITIINELTKILDYDKDFYCSYVYDVFFKYYAYHLQRFYVLRKIMFGERIPIGLVE